MASPTSMAQLKRGLLGPGQCEVTVNDPYGAGSCSPDVYVYARFWVVALSDEALRKLQQKKAGKEVPVGEPRNLPHREIPRTHGICLGTVPAGSKLVINPKDLPDDEQQVAFFILDPVTGELVPAEVLSQQPGTLMIMLPDALNTAIQDAWTPE